MYIHEFFRSFFLLLVLFFFSLFFSKISIFLKRPVAKILPSEDLHRRMVSLPHEPATRFCSLREANEITVTAHIPSTVSLYIPPLFPLFHTTERFCHELQIAIDMVSLLPQVLLLLFFFLSPARTSGGRLSLDQADLVRATADFGNLVHDQPSAVYFPAGAVDLAELVASSYRVESPFGVGARGHGHSIAGQAQAAGGVVVEMASGSWDPPKVGVTGSGLPYVDARGGEMWVDVLGATLEHGLAPRSWTDYLHLTVGGTLSNAGISGQAFQHGPQISNVFELDVVTGNNSTTSTAHFSSTTGEVSCFLYFFWNEFGFRM